MRPPFKLSVTLCLLFFSTNLLVAQNKSNSNYELVTEYETFAISVLDAHSCDKKDLKSINEDDVYRFKISQNTSREIDYVELLRMNDRSDKKSFTKNLMKAIYSSELNRDYMSDDQNCVILDIRHTP